MRNSTINYCSTKLFHYYYMSKRTALCNKVYQVLRNCSGKRCLSSTVIKRVKGFNNEEEERASLNIVVPEKFNFASDVIDKWAEKERNGLRKTSVPAFWHVSDEGKEHRFTYEELEYKSKKIASILENECGIKHGEFVIVMLPKIPESWLVNLAAIRVGLVFVPTSMMMTVKDLEYRFKALEPSNVIAHESVAEIIDEATKSIPSLKNKIIISEKPSRRPGWFDLNHFRSGETNHKCASTRSDEAMMIYFTSGTTGMPKMVEHTHSSFGLGSQTYGKYVLDLTAENVVWNMSDTGWAFTAYNFFGAWSVGAGLFIHQMLKFSPIETLKVMAKYPIDTLASAPMVYSSLLNENMEDYKFRNMQHFFSGGDNLTKELLERWFARTGFYIYNGYGQTETTGLIAQRKSFEFRFGSMGKSAPGVTATVVDENENIVDPGVVGEIVAERKNQVGLFKGYKNNPEATKAVLTDKYYHTGDLGYLDKDGYFWFVGRKDDVINSAGYRIGPSEVEQAIVDHPAVAEAAVVGSPDKERGEVVKGFIVLKASVKPSEELIKEIQEHCKHITAPYKYPRKIEFVAELPKSPSGKVKRSELRKKERDLAKN